MSPDKFPNLTEEQKRAIEDMYFADCPITVLDDVPQEAIEYYYHLFECCDV